jgi:hypothetical protein
MASSPEVIHAWSAPRSLSTSLMYSFSQVSHSLPSSSLRPNPHPLAHCGPVCESICCSVSRLAPRANSEITG